MKENSMKKYNVTDLSVKKLGRTRIIDDVYYLTYSGSEIGFFYDGDHLEAELVSDKMSMMPTLKGCVAVMIDGDDVAYNRIAFVPGEQTVTLFDKAEYASWKGVPESELPEKMGIHVIKFSEAAFGTVGIKAILAEEKATFEALPAKKHRIEYIGDSITCGYGVEGIFEKDVFTTEQENPHLSFSIKSAKKLDADYQLISWSGIGIISDYIDPDVEEPLQDVLIQELYPYADKKLDERLKLEPEAWAFDNFKPEVIVLNIGTNDSSYTREKEDRENWYADEMKKFIRVIHEKNEDAQIAFCYGVMDHTLCPVIERLVAEMNAEGCDYIHYLELPMQDEKVDGYAVDYHPCEVTHEKSSVLVYDFISQLMKW